MKTARFAEVVKRSGRPRVHALWVAPERDREFAQARKQNRVMTVEQPERGKADVGLVGFDRTHGAGSQFLVFPKPLTPFNGARVVGVKFDLVDQPARVPAKPETPRPHPHRKSGAEARSSPPPVPAAIVRDRSTANSTHQTLDTRAPPARGDASPDPVESARARTPSSPPASRTRRTVAHPKTTGAAPTSARAADDASLRAAVRAALGELRDGKAVAAYQRLERALGE